MAWWWWLLIPALLLPLSWFIYSSVTNPNNISEENRHIVTAKETQSRAIKPNAPISHSNPSTSGKPSITTTHSIRPENGKTQLESGFPKPNDPSKSFHISGISRTKANPGTNTRQETAQVPVKGEGLEIIQLFPRSKVALKSASEPWNPSLEEFIKPIHPFVDKTLDAPNFRKPGWSIGAYSSVNRYNQLHRAENTNYENYRSNAETPSVSWEGGFIAQYNTGKWTYASGAIYSPKTQWLKGQVRYMIYDSFPHLNPQGNIIGYFRLNYRDTVATLEQRATYTFLDIPVQIGREIPIGQKSSLIPSAGMMISFLTGTHGQSIGTDLGLHQVSDAAVFDYKKSMRSLQAEIKYRYYVKPGWSVNTGIQYKHGLSSLMEDASVEQKFRQLGWLFEFQYQF